MSQVTARNAVNRAGASLYQRLRPESTLLYRIIERYYPLLTDQLAAQGRTLPAYISAEFEAYLQCGRLQHGFLRVQCDRYRSEHLVAFKHTGVKPYIFPFETYIFIHSNHCRLRCHLTVQNYEYRFKCYGNGVSLIAIDHLLTT